MDASTTAILILLSAIALIVLLIVKMKFHAFIALVIACIYVGLISGMPLDKIAGSIESGIGGTLGFLATVVGFGTVLGKMLETSGGAERLARTLLDKLGEQRAVWAMMIVGLTVGIPVLFEVGFIILFPLVYFVARKTRMSLVYLGVPLAISLMIVHCMVPPHPAAFMITETLGADVGKVIMYSLLVAIPTAIISGPVFGKFISQRCTTGALPAGDTTSDPTPDNDLPGFGITLFTALLPLGIMITKTIVTLFLSKESAIYSFVSFVGHPVCALLIALLVAYYTLGISRGVPMKDLLPLTSDSFGPIAGIMLIIGAGGAFNGILTDSGLGKHFSDAMLALDMNPILLAWLVAAFLHFAIGSATVSMISAAGMVLPMLPAYPELSPEILVLAIGSGAIGWCHVNDSSFWFIKEFLGLSLQDMLKSFTVATLIASFVSLTSIMLLAQAI